MSDPLYRKELLRLAADAHGAGRLRSPNAAGSAHNPACGDKVTVDMVISEGRVTDFAHDTKACVLAQASSSILGRTLKGASRRDVEELRQAIAAMLSQHRAAPAPPFQDYSVFDGAVEFASRHRCVLLPLEAVLAAFDQSS